METRRLSVLAQLLLQPLASLAQPVQRFRASGGVERFETQPRLDAAFAVSVLLSHDLVQVLHRSSCGCFRQRLSRLADFPCLRLDRLFVPIAHARFRSRLGLQPFAKKPRCRFTIPLGTQPQVQRVAD